MLYGPFATEEEIKIWNVYFPYLGVGWSHVLFAKFPKLFIF